MHQVLVFVNLFCCGIVTGTYCFEMLVVVPAANHAPTELSAQLHGALFSHLPNRYMPFLGVTAGLSGAALLLLETLSDQAVAFYLVGLVAWIATSVILVGFSRPLDKTITGWAASEVPADEYARARKKWNGLMVTRGPLGLLGFVCFLVGALS